MTATYEQIEDEARRRFDENQCSTHTLAHYIIDVTREGWTPPEPVDPDLLAVRGLLADQATNRIAQQAYLNGWRDTQVHFQTALAAYKAGRTAR